MPGSFEITGPAISSDQLDSWMGEEPFSQDLLVAAQKDFDGVVAL
jgi:hypothetical protein